MRSPRPAFLLAVPPARAQVAQTFRPIVSDHDFDSGTMTYALLSATPQQGNARAKTSGSSATVTAASGTPFDAVAAGAELTFEGLSGTFPAVRYVISKASGSEITVDPPIDLSTNGSTGYIFTYRTLATGTGDDVGWFPVSTYTGRTLFFQLEQLSLASGDIDVQIDCKGSSPWAKPTKVYPPSSGTTQCETGGFTTAGATARCAVVIDEVYGWCRLGVDVNADDGGDTGANRERITAYLEARR